MKKEEIVSLLAKSTSEEKVYLILDIVDEIDDWEWIQNILLGLVNDKNFWVAKNAITALSDIARIHKKMDKRKVVAELNKIANPDLQNIIVDVLNDIDIFVE